MAENDNGQQGEESEPEIQRHEMRRASELYRLIPHDKNEDPVLGTVVIGRLNEEFDKKDLYIPGCDKYDERKEFVLILQILPHIRAKKDKLCVHAVDEVRYTPAFKQMRDVFFQSCPSKALLSYSWFIVNNNLMLNMHLNGTYLLDKIVDVPRDENCRYCFFNHFISALRPNLAGEIFRHRLLRKSSKYDGPAHVSIDFETLYETIRCERQALQKYQLRLNSLACVLRPYQRDAADFLVHREIEPAVNVGQVHESVCVSENLYYLPSLGGFVRDASDCAVNVPGGILADEMGLGKTVELLTLILTHRSEKDADELRRTRDSKDGSLENNSASDESDNVVMKLMDELISKVSAVCDGAEGLKTLKRAKNLTITEKRNNSYYLGSADGNKAPHNIGCSECGARWATNKVHWLPEFSQRQLIFNCPTCISKGSFINVSATLIVVPKAICHQWYEEIKKHVKDDVKIDMYMGVAVDGYKHPYYFDQFHIVITTYDVLGREFQHLSAHNDNYAKRIRKRTYEAAKKVITPFPNINWWRVCLDEWQLVKGGRQGEVCWQLEARYKWCISGTPLVQSYNDFFRMLRFIELRPYDCITLWERKISNHILFQGNVKPLVDLMSQVFWRNSKNNVKDQLHIPPKKEVITYVLLSPVEMEYYKLKLDETKRILAATLARFNRRIHDDAQMDQIPRNIYNDLIETLNSIRWALVTGDGYLKEKPSTNPGTSSSSPTHFTGMTAQDVLERVIKKTRIVLVEATRAVVKQLNELAAHKMRANIPNAAVDCYLRVMASVAEYESKIKALTFTEWGLTSDLDMRQRIHATANLLEVCLTSCPDRFSNDDLSVYKAQLSKLKEGFNNYNTTKDALEAISQTLAPMQNEVTTRVDVLKQSLPNLTSIFEGIPERAFNKLIKEDLAEFVQSRPLLGKKPTAIVLLEEMEKTVLERQEQLRDFLVDFNPFSKFIEVFVTDDVSQFLKILYCSHNKDIERDGERINKLELCRTYCCPLCLMNRRIFKIELSLSISEQRKRAKTARSLDSRVAVPLKEDVLFKAFSTINKIATSKDSETETFTAFKDWMNSVRQCMQDVTGIMDSIQQYITKEREVVSAQSRDDIDLDYEKLKRLLCLNKDTYEKDYDLHLTITLDRREEQRRKAFGKISYVHSWLDQHEEELECPVCYMELESPWNMFPCLHNMCRSCYPRYIKSSSLNCVVCRAPFNLKEVQSVEGFKRKTAPSPEPEPMIKNIGNYTVEQYNIKGLKLTFKMAAVMRNIEAILKDNPNNKIIVFSAMNSALLMLSQIMKSVEIKHTLFNARTLNLEDLATFKQSHEVKVLLLPLSFGANGLNLVEANHVFFMEPIPNASLFQQAMGRVYRMGQTRATTIHHLIAKDTIEETIHSIVTSKTETGLTFGSFKKILGLS